MLARTLPLFDRGGHGVFCTAVLMGPMSGWLTSRTSHSTGAPAALCLPIATTGSSPREGMAARRHAPATSQSRTRSQWPSAAGEEFHSIGNIRKRGTAHPGSSIPGTRPRIDRAARARDCVEPGLQPQATSLSSRMWTSIARRSRRHGRVLMTAHNSAGDRSMKTIFVSGGGRRQAGAPGGTWRP